MVKLIGYIILGISLVFWGLILVVPFLGFSTGKIAAVTTGLIVGGEVTFYLSLFLIGKDFLVKIKNRFRVGKSKVAKPEK